MNVYQKLKILYNSLADEESRVIFLNRMKYMLDEDVNNFIDMFKALSSIYILKNNKRINSIYDILSDDDLAKRPVVLYGAGFVGIHAVSFFNLAEIPVVCFCDKDTQKHGTKLLGVPIEPPSVLGEKYTDANIVITTVNFEDEIRQELLDMGMAPDRIFTTVPNRRQYFWNNIFEPREGEVYVDVGCKDGDSIIDYCKWNPRYGKIYGFEPDPENVWSTITAVEKQEITGVTIIEKGAWSSEKVLEFSNDAAGYSRFLDVGSLTYYNRAGLINNEEAFLHFNADVQEPALKKTVKIPVTTIDKVLKDEKVSFIKMDIEGSELEALKGATMTIVKCKPILAVCLYHKLEDIIELPLYLLQHVPEYKIYIRHHDLSTFETVMYAVAD